MLQIWPKTTRLYLNTVSTIFGLFKSNAVSSLLLVRQQLKDAGRKVTWFQSAIEGAGYGLQTTDYIKKDEIIAVFGGRGFNDH